MTYNFLEDWESSLYSMLEIKKNENIKKTYKFNILDYKVLEKI